MAWIGLTFTIGLLLLAAMFGIMAIVSKKDRPLKASAAALIFILWMFPASAVAFGGIAYSEGTYTGYPVALSSGGIIYDTTGVALKTDRDSSAHEEFCVLEQDHEDLLRQAAEGDRYVRIEYTRHVWWEDGCQFENQNVVRSVEIMPSEPGARP